MKEKIRHVGSTSYHMLNTEVYESQMWPCPFCGGDAELQEGAKRDGTGFFKYAKCMGCRAQTAVTVFDGTPDGEHKAIIRVMSMWNRRP